MITIKCKAFLGLLFVAILLGHSGKAAFFAVCLWSRLDLAVVWRQLN